MLRRLGKPDLQHVSAWAKRELHSLRSTSEEPICVALKGGNYTVGTYLVEKQDNGWLVNDMLFSSKRNAIFYCAYMHTKQFRVADQLRELDQRIQALEADKELFRFRLDNAHRKENEWEIGLYSSRFEEVKGRLRIVKNEAEKILIWNKYLNILG